MAGVSYEQLMKIPFVMKLVKKLHGCGSTLQRFYGLGPMNRPSQSIQGRTGVYDTFLASRSLMPVRSPMSGPGRLNRKPVGQQVITVMRNYNAIPVEDELVFRNRPLGGQYSQVDDSGQSYITRQVKYGIELIENNHEFMAAKMFQGGWGLKPSGEDLLLTSKTDADATIVVDTLLPASNTGNLPIRASAADVITALWTNPATDIISQLFILQAEHARLNGNPLRHIWLNGLTFAPIMMNTGLQDVGGSAYRVFDTLTHREIDPGARYPDTGVDVVFRALPEYTFHIYNSGYIMGQVAQSFAAQTSTDNWEYFIPTGKAIITPEPGDWCGLVAGSEPVQFNLQEAPRVVSGFAMGKERHIDPPRWDIKFLNNSAPALFVERSSYYATIG